jgi:simple sugar transport system permease protein
MVLRLEARGQDSRLIAYLSPLLAGTLTLICGSLLFLMLGKDPLLTLWTFFIKPVHDAYGLAELAIKAAPILLCASGLAICYRANVWNIGAEGQLLMGALIGGWVALALGDAKGIWVLPLVLLAGTALVPWTERMVAGHPLRRSA